MTAQVLFVMFFSKNARTLMPLRPFHVTLLHAVSIILYNSFEQFDTRFV